MGRKNRQATEAEHNAAEAQMREDMDALRDPRISEEERDRITDTVVNGPPVGDAENAAAAYNESEVERSNRIAREKDARAVGQDVKPKESKAERFKRLAQKRVTKALLVLSHVQNLTNSNSYSYTPEQAQKVIDALVLAVNRIVDGFSGTKNGKQSFTL